MMTDTLENDDLTWIVNDLEEFRSRLDELDITEYEGVCDPMLDGRVIVRMNWCRFRNGRERGSKRTL